MRERDPFGGALMVVISGTAHAIGSQLADRMLVAR